MHIDQITTRIIGCGIIIHRELGPGLLESAYEGCFEDALRRAGLHVERQKTLPLRYGNVTTKQGYRPDLLVERAVVVEVKAVKTIDLVIEAQMNTYLRLLNYRIGLIINFNVRWLKNGIRRIINSEFSKSRPPLR